VLGETSQAGVTLEVDRFNLECGTRPVRLDGRPFAALGDELGNVLRDLRQAAGVHGGRLVAIGILPTLEERDLQPDVLTQTHRYRALSSGLKRLRQAPFEIRIDGADSLTIACDDVTFEGANTSWQVHLRVPPAEFARTYNAAQIAAGPVLAVAGNSPLFLGRRLWQETRIALYRQSVDERFAAGADDWRPARVSFGHGWVRGGALELFAESVTMHAPLLAPLGPEEPRAARERGVVPELRELCLHHGTVWRWNRAVYDATCGGHLRIEMRSLPAGPTLVDMLANTAFLLGLTLALAPEAERLTTAVTFGQARRNFYAAARDGLDAEMLWPTADPPSPRPVPVASLVRDLIEPARRGLVQAGVETEEADRLLGVIAERNERRMTGARWQLAALAALEPGRSRREALAAMLERYLDHAQSGEPVHRWPIPG
jgi:hypothetical protein